MHLDRRAAIKATALSLFGAAMYEGTIPNTRGQLSHDGLASLAASCGMKVGVSSSTGRFLQFVFGPFLHANFNMVTPPLKWTSLRPSPGEYAFTEADQQFAYASKHGLSIHGHNLCWNASNPPWFDSVLTKHNARGYLTNYIHTVVGRYRGRVDSWDVVNEPIALWNNRPDGLRKGPWLDLIGPEYIDIAFHTAQEVDAGCLLTLNLNGCEEQNSYGDQVRASSLSLVRALLKRGVPVQAVALESHIDAPWKPRDAGHINFIRGLRDIGVVVYISEFDVNDTGIQGNEEQVKAAVAQSYCDYLTDFLTAGPLNRLTFWSVSDLSNWYDAIAVTKPRWRRADGKQHHPGLIDDKFVPSPAYDAVHKVLTTSCSGGR
jgi:endo-1,4-beta-xylanase